MVSHDLISGNITATISDHLPQFLFLFQRYHAKNPIFMKEFGQNLFKQSLYFTILITIGLMLFSLTNKTSIPP